MDKHDRQTKYHRHRQCYGGWLPEKKRAVGRVKGKEVQYVLTEGDLTLVVNTQCNIQMNCTPETFIL